jgi:CRP-like cAMP-binding protein
MHAHANESYMKAAAYHQCASPSQYAAPSPQLQQNQLLGSLPAAVQERLFPYLDLVSLPLGESLYEPGSTMRHIYFPVDCIVSLMYVTEDGQSAEISVVGNDGFVGVPVLMGDERTSGSAVVQNAGTAYQLSGRRLKVEIDRHDELLRLMLRYTQSLITQIAQTAICNRHHSIDQQLCRWLLVFLDRHNGSNLFMTQERIANKLGVRREGVTEAAGKLQKLEVIQYTRGRIKVLNRPRLEQLSCECYRVLREETDRLMPTTANFMVR